MREKYATWDGPLSRSEEHIDDIDVDFYTFYLVEAKKNTMSSNTNILWKIVTLVFCSLPTSFLYCSYLLSDK